MKGFKKAWQEDNKGLSLIFLTISISSFLASFFAIRKVDNSPYPIIITALIAISIFFGKDSNKKSQDETKNETYKGD
ncbi:MAG: DUF2970 domain-containing protein [Caldisericum sp.]|nr:DUF2970 domain-containing protein [Caldisericum sp.]